MFITFTWCFLCCFFFFLTQLLIILKFGEFSFVVFFFSKQSAEYSMKLNINTHTHTHTHTRVMLRNVFQESVLCSTFLRRSFFVYGLLSGGWHSQCFSFRSACSLAFDALLSWTFSVASPPSLSLPSSHFSSCAFLQYQPCDNPWTLVLNLLTSAFQTCRCGYQELLGWVKGISKLCIKKASLIPIHLLPPPNSFHPANLVSGDRKSVV